MKRFLNWLSWFSALLWEETLCILKEPTARTILIIPLIVQSFLFGYAATFDLNNIPYSVLNESNGKYSRALLAQIDNSATFHRGATIQNASQIAGELKPSGSLLVLAIPTNFDARVAQGLPAQVGIFVDGRNSTTANLAAAELSSIISKFNQRELGVASVIEVEERAWFNPNLLTRWNLVTSLIATLAFIQVLMLSAMSVSREREQGTFDQLLVTPYRPVEILLAKALPPVFIGLFQSCLVLLIAYFWFGIPFRGSFTALFAGLIVFTLSTVGIGLSISSLSETMQQSMIYSFVLIVPMVILSGLITPVENMPEALQWFAYINPLTYILDIVHKVYLQNASLAGLWTKVIPLMIISCFTMPFAAWFFRKQV